jgi:hypothetical protein
MVSLLQQFAPTVIALIVIAALALLWRNSRSVWLVGAIIAELVALVARGAFSLVPGLMRSMPMLLTVWSLSALLFAVCLLGYAIEQNASVQSRKAKP